ncbi:MAG: NAD(P)/FAD-dependent oxidoreductase, partial [Myxococcales bacterium]|nr:NAD(P)/FAD-dependent oxidoreductase [Myxococcales bacterium]
WRDNTYPGAACDVPSYLYSYSFEPSARWSRAFAEQPEILAYIEHCADKYGLRPFVRFGAEVAGARFDETAAVWRVALATGDEVVARVLVSGVGQLHRPRVPAIPGLERFEGASFHSARWRHDLDLRGRRVAVVGNAASAIQFIPRIAPLCARLTVFQRSANWILPKPDRAYSALEKGLLTRFPALAWLYRARIYWALELRWPAFREGSFWRPLLTAIARRELRRQVADPKLRAALTPDYPFGCKRILISNDYYPAMARENVSLVTSPIEAAEADALRTRDGERHVADTLIFATGFETTRFLAPMRVEGLGGKNLEKTWAEGAEAYLGMTAAGFPNFFILYGPNTNLAHNSILFMLECQVRYVVQCVRRIRERRLAYLDLREDEMARYNAAVQRDLGETVWDAECGSWYKLPSGKITNNWPHGTLAFWWRTRRPRWEAFREVQAGSGPSRLP